MPATAVRYSCQTAAKRSRSRPPQTETSPLTWPFPVALRGLEPLTPTLPAPQMRYWSVLSDYGPYCFRRSTLARHAAPCRPVVPEPGTSVPTACPPRRSRPDHLWHVSLSPTEPMDD